MHKFVVISSSSKVLRDVQDWASDKRYSVELYTDEEWKDIEKKIVPLESHLPKGINPADIKSLKDLESRVISSLLVYTSGNITKVANILKVGRATVYRKIRENSIGIEDLRDKDGKKLKVA